MIDERLLFRIPEAAGRLGLSRSTLYELIAADQIPVIRVGRAVRIAAADVAIWWSASARPLRPADAQPTRSVGASFVSVIASEHLTAALSYARRGERIFPVCFPDPVGGCGCGQGHKGHDIGKAPIGRLAPNGFKDATTDEAKIRVIERDPPVEEGGAQGKTHRWRKPPAAASGSPLTSSQTSPPTNFLIVGSEASEPARDRLDGVRNAAR